MGIKGSGMVGGQADEEVECREKEVVKV